MSRIFFLKKNIYFQTIKMKSLVICIDIASSILVCILVFLVFILIHKIGLNDILSSIQKIRNLIQGKCMCLKNYAVFENLPQKHYAKCLVIKH